MARSSSSSSSQKGQEWPPWDFMPPPGDREWRTRNPAFEKYPLINEYLRLRGELRQIRLYSPLCAKYRVVSLSSGQYDDLSVEEIVAQCEDRGTAIMLAKKAQLQEMPLSRASRHQSCATMIPPADSPEAVPLHTTKAMPRTEPAAHNIPQHHVPSNESAKPDTTHGTTEHNVVAATKCTESRSEHLDTNNSAQKVTPNAQGGMPRKRIMKQLEIKMLEHNHCDTKKRRSLEKPIRVTGSRVVKGRRSVGFKV